ncbi:MAG: methyltransferase domain-containing protein [Gemmatimonadaceae bacterium]
MRERLPVSPILVRQRLPRFLQRSYAITCAARIAVNYAKAARYRLGHIDTSSGTVHTGLEIDASVEYIRRVYDDYKQYAGRESFHGRLAELGPGDNCGVALLFMGDGCESADLLDRFYSTRDTEVQRRIYERLFADHPPLATRFAEADLSADDSFPGVRWHYGPSAAAEVFFRDHRDFDVIVSRAVLEHLYDPIEAIHDMARALKPGGLMMHAVDLRDHGIFSTRFHELKYLEVPGAIYPHMTRASGGPNRILTPAYRAALEEEGLEFRILVAGLAGSGLLDEYVEWGDIPAARRSESLRFVRSVRGRFAAQIRTMSDEDLAINSIFIVARRPERTR